jgi:Gpi18-like mannosyltransferase
MTDTEHTSKTRRGHTYLAALLLFASSRAVMLLAMAFANRLLPLEPTASTWDATNRWFRFLLRYDSGWYLHIATHGYSYTGNDLEKQNVVFYPLYPAMIKGLTFLGLSHAASAVIVSNVAMVAAIIVFTKLVAERYDKETAVGAVAFLSFFPGSLFFSAAYTESLALLFIVCFFLFLLRKRFVVAACFAGLCFATRSTGLVLLAPLAWDLIRHYWPDQRRRLMVQGPLCMLIATAGLWLYMIYLWAAFRAPLAFMTGQSAWNEGSHFGNPLLLQPVFKALVDLRYQLQNFIADPNALSFVMFVVFVALIVIFRKRMTVSMLLFCAGALLLPYFTRTGAVGFASFTRYVMLVFPVFIIAATLSKRRIWLGLAICGISGALLFWYTALFAKWYWVG